MNRLVLTIAAIGFLISGTLAQVTIDPFCFDDQTDITIYYDATQGTSGLVGASKVYMHAGVITDSPSGTSWQYVVGNWGDDDGIGQMTKVAGQSDLWEISLKPRDYFDVPAGTTIYRLGMVFRNEDGSKEGKNDQNADIFMNLSDGSLSLLLTDPVPALVDQNEVVQIDATSCSPADFVLFVNDVQETSQSATTTFSYAYTATQNPGETVELRLEATGDSETDQLDISFAIRTPTVEEARPAGIIDGINYDDADPTKVTLSFWAPLKSSVYVTGDFTDWLINSTSQMKKDGEHFWLEISGLNPGQEYGYQYWVDEEIFVADPYADKILDPDDKWIPTTTYPGLKAYPVGAQRASWHQNRVAVLQTNQPEYNWVNTKFDKPAKEKLIIYELLVRDFLGESNMNYQSLIDTLDYIENLGVNAIELMPIMEFNGNDSWGYNPTFMFAVDKAYGTRNDLKAFIDECHTRGIAVILDMVMNQNDVPSPYASMYFDFTGFNPTSDNPWFNQVPKHPFNVFSDINHESSYTKAWLDTVNYYWLNEFKFDGYRFDLSKGFTQRNTYPDNVGGWSSRDDSRIALLKRMADKIWEQTPDAYVILEHFADNSEERILSDYGMMLWGNHMYDYSEAAMGYANGKSIGGAYYKNRGWNENGLIAYMESHDEERQMYKLLEYGNSAGTYNTKQVNTALQRLKLTGTFFFTVPGPKMIWQFGEFGYDIPIEFNGRTGRKPTKWEYLEDQRRSKLVEVYKELIGLRHKYDVFTEGEFSWQPSGNLKSIHITKGDSNVVIVGNFDVLPGEMNPGFQHTGTWYDFFSSHELEVTDLSAPMQIGPGEFHIYTDQRLHQPNYDIITGIEDSYLETMIEVFPNPAIEYLNLMINANFTSGTSWEIRDILGKAVLSGELDTPDQRIDISTLSHGVHFISVISGNNHSTVKFIKD
jgi:1,4-alpha-glucan branching enzyme